MSPAEREKASILIVEPETALRNGMRQTLIGLGYANVSDAPNHMIALKKFEERPVTHVIFEAKKTNMPVNEFVAKILDIDDSVIAIPTSGDPSVDDVFNLLIIGARGYIVKPFTAEGIEIAMVMATKGEPISESILFAKNRNQALAGLVMTSFGKLATIMRQAEQFETARREVPKKMLAFQRAIDIAKTFAEGGETNFTESIVDFCCDRGDGPASRLGRIRKRLEAKKAERAARDDAKDPKLEDASAG